jgi:beta-mannosidase
MAAGLIADPFVGDEELRVQWVAERDWEYRRTFTVDAEVAAEEHLALVFDGLDTLAEVRLNGKLLGNANNMFRTWRWDVAESLVAGENEMTVTFASAVRFCAEHEAERYLDRPKDANTMPGGPYLRKAPCHFGWDWGPKLPNIGIWQDLRLDGWSVAKVTDVRLTQKIEGGRARIAARVEVERTPGSAAALAITVRVAHPNGRVDSVVASVPAGRSGADLAVDVADPELWWPNGLGAQPLYHVEIELAAGDRQLDRRHFQVGLRTLELRREPDAWGESFTFVVNGVAVFAKGSNWIPADSFPARVTPDMLDSLLGAAAATNHNMIRIWGGGYYETEVFYDLCDRYGILVWQDFMFACSVYPLTEPEFLANLEMETREQVRRLRHRACLALWCGNNEMERGWTIWGWDRPENADLKAAYLRYFSVTLAEWVAAEDAATPYWPSSPSSGRPLEAPIGGNSGDEHEWIVWHALAPFSAYGHETYRFVSEFGFESLPAMATVAAFAPDPSDWNLGSPMLDHHQRCTVGNARILYYMAQQFRLPKDFSSFVYLSQVLHAEAMRVGVEHWRRLRDRCSGALYWQLNDCWPVSSWASIDYYGRWKALQYATRRFYAPVLLTIEVEKDGVSVAVTNDLAVAWQGEVRWSLESLGGEVVASGREGVAAAGTATTPICLVPIADIKGRDFQRGTVLVAELWADGGSGPAARTVTTFGPDKQLLLALPTLELSLAAEAGGSVGAAAAGRRVTAHLRSDTLARWVELALDGADVIFDDNYVDLPAGRELTVGFELPDGWTIERARAALRVRSVIDTYA